MKNEHLIELLRTELGGSLQSVTEAYGEVTLRCEPNRVIMVLRELRDHDAFAFDQLIDLCAVDYLQYGHSDWETDAATECGFSRGVAPQNPSMPLQEGLRFCVVYHLLSTRHNQRLRVVAFLEESHLMIPSAHELWKCANWYEREAYDLYGILFEGHPDLRRLLTDYGFIGHPFRKDFPLSGEVEMRYDAESKRVIYEPVDIQRRILVPKVIRHDNRYLHTQEEGA